jgi:Sugar (and other) transporter
MFGLAAIPPVVQFVGFIFMPESPRWLYGKKKYDKARTVLQQIRGTSDVEQELIDIEHSCLQDADSGW